MPGPLSAIVLAGGASRRLGRDKAAITFGGRPLLDVVIGRVSIVCDEVIVAGAGARDVVGLAVRCVEDRVPGRGPLAGLDAGLRVASAEFALTVACDMPFLDPHLLAAMAALPRDYQALVPVSGGRRHPLHAIYSRACLPAIESLLAAGGGSLEDLLSRVAVRELPEDGVRALDPEGLSVFNLNDAADLGAARDLWERLEKA